MSRLNVVVEAVFPFKSPVTRLTLELFFIIIVLPLVLLHPSSTREFFSTFLTLEIFFAVLSTNVVIQHILTSYLKVTLRTSKQFGKVHIL